MQDTTLLVGAKLAEGRAVFGTTGYDSDSVLRQLCGDKVGAATLLNHCFKSVVVKALSRSRLWISLGNPRNSSGWWSIWLRDSRIVVRKHVVAAGKPTTSMKISVAYVDHR